MTYHILLIENTYKLQKQVRDYFVKRSCGDMKIDLAENGWQGMELVHEKEYDLVLLDAVLPEASGFQICMEIRQISICPIIFLLPGNSQELILKAYHLGGDDYVVKPFYLVELYAKVNALLRRSKGLIQSARLVCGNISLDPGTMVVYVNDREVSLPNKEYLLLRTMISWPGKVFDREQLIVSVWGYDYEGSERVVDNHIKKLRQLLGDAGGQIVTVIGWGYRLLPYSA